MHVSPAMPAFHITNQIHSGPSHQPYDLCPFRQISLSRQLSLQCISPAIISVSVSPARRSVSISPAISFISVLPIIYSLSPAVASNWPYLNLSHQLYLLCLSSQPYIVCRSCQSCILCPSRQLYILSLTSCSFSVSLTSCIRLGCVLSVSPVI